MKGKLKIAAACSFVFILAFASYSQGASFSADLVKTIDGKSETGKFYFSDSNYRMEIVEDGQPVVIIADKDKKVHWILDTQAKTVIEIPSESRKLLSIDTFLLSDYLFAEYESHVRDKEKINNIECEKQEIPSQNYMRWVLSEFQFPIKILLYEGEKARRIDELQNIKPGPVPESLFKVPADFRQKEDPAEAEKRKREEQRKAETALPALTKIGKEQVPCNVKIAAGGELHIAIDTDRHAFLEVTNMVLEESELMLTRYRDGKPSSVYPQKSWKLDRNGRNTWDFNDESHRGDEEFLVDEVVIKVNKGLVYAYMRQAGKDRKDFYNRGQFQNGAGIDPKRPVKIQITGDNPFGPKTTGEFCLSHESGAKAEVVSFTVENGKTLTWDYPAAKGVKGVYVTIKELNGRAKISVIQPSDPAKDSAKKHTTAPKAVKPAVDAQNPKSQSSAGAPPAMTPPLVNNGTSASADGTIFDGKVPLMKGAQVTKEISMGAMTQVDLDVPGSAESIISFYNKTMAAMGWKI